MSVRTEEQKNRAIIWFKDLRDQLCVAFEVIEDDCSREGAKGFSPARFERTSWDRDNGGGGGEMSVLKNGRVLEKAGVNISVVHGEFSKEFSAKIPGASEDPRFWAAGISLVVHPRSPMVPIAHMNTRMIVTTQGWFGGGGDLTPVFPVDQDTEDFHCAFKKACDAHDPAYYPKYKEWCDRYFYLPHREETRGVGGIFYDNLDTGNWEKDFTFTQDIGKSFLDIYPNIIRRHMNEDWTDEEKQKQLAKRGRYVEFNLIYDRGTLFGLKTGGNIEAILMSLPPEASWP
jgi:coproporphyrinogen III oxidase